MPDVSTSGDRQIVFKRLDVMFGPLNIATNGTPPVSQILDVSAQVFCVDTYGNSVALDRPILLSTVNPRRIRFNIPYWLTGTVTAGSNAPVFLIRYSSANTTAVQSYNIMAMLRARGDITQPMVSNF
jgi:hypothetical protein